MKAKTFLFGILGVILLVAVTLISCQKEKINQALLQANQGNNMNQFSNMRRVPVELRESDVEIGKRILTLIAKGLVGLTTNKDFVNLVNAEVAKQFDEDFNVLLRDLIMAARKKGIDITNEMRKSIVRMGGTNDDIALVNMYVNYIPVEGHNFYPQIFIPYFDEIDLSKQPIVTPDWGDADEPGFKEGEGGGPPIEIIVPEDDVVLKSAPYWVISINERVNDGGNVGDIINADLCKCGNGICEPERGCNDETKDNCIDCQYTCGNGVCESLKGENNNNCFIDCNVTLTCGNGKCDGLENYKNCPNDCPPPVCGNGKCELGETHLNCPSDCSDINVKITNFKFPSSQKFESGRSGRLEVRMVGMVYTPCSDKYYPNQSTYTLLDCRDRNDVVGCEVSNPKKKDVGDNVLYPDKPIIYAWPEDAEKMFITLYEYDAWPAGRHCDRCASTNNAGSYDQECGKAAIEIENWCKEPGCDDCKKYKGCINKYRSRFQGEYWLNSCGNTVWQIARSEFVYPGYKELGNPYGDDFFIRFEWFR